MAAPASAKVLPMQLPNSLTPIAQVSGSGDSLGLTDKEGNPLQGNFTLPAFITPAWLYLLSDLFSSGAGATSAVSGIVKGQFTLTPNATSTQVLSNKFFTTSIFFWSPATPHAANDMATTSGLVTSTGVFTLTHANNARTDRTFNYICVN